MDHLKYIITDRKGWAVFNNLQTHKEIAEKLYGTPISAGFIRFGTKMNIECWGESVSLKLKSKEQEDADFLKEHIYK